MGQITHKMSYSKIYRKWTAMISRCKNPKNPNYINYGGRGISVCNDWNEFYNFYRDMGNIPFDKAQIDRIDNEKEYCKENCRWVSCKENSRNRRTTKKHGTHSGNMVQAELIEKIGWTKDQFRWFLKKNGISWILENFKNNSLPLRTNQTVDRHDLCGSQFGDWTVLEFKSYEKKTGHLYLCKCKCGKEKLIPRNNLMKNKTTKCRSCAALYQWHRKKQIDTH